VQCLVLSDTCDATPCWVAALRRLATNHPIGAFGAKKSCVVSVIQLTESCQVFFG